MKFNAKDYKISKTKDYLRKNHLFFFFNGVNRNSNNWISTEQALKTLNFSYYKVFNKTAIQTLKNSIYRSTESKINGTTFFIKLCSNEKPLSRHVLLNNFEPLLFVMLAVKLNNKIYGPTQVKNTNLLEYRKSVLVFFQFGVTHLKSCFNFKKDISK